MPEQQRRYLRFLWTDEDGKLMPYQYNRHIFGANSSPTCANYALQQCAKLFELEHPIALQVVMDNFYVDDMLISVHTTEQASEVIHELKSLLAKGGFSLTKWISNFEEIFENSEITPIESEDIPKVLGLEWIASDDLLTVRKDQEFPQKTNWTQRQVLSTVSQVFDPLGFMTPFVIRGRMLMKRIWQTQGQKWDSPVAEDLNTEFNKWVQEWSKSEQLSVPRRYNQEACDRVELQVFGDASEDAFRAVSYVLITKPNGDRLIRFIVGKTRVAPMKQHTIPKLELVSAVTANTIKDLILKEHRISIASICLWSDSTTVLQWLRNSDKKQPTFVANRKAEILDSSIVDQWRHIAGADNPADLGTRGLSINELMQSDWINGQDWLQSKINETKNWEQEEVVPDREEVFTSNSNEKADPIDWKRFSNFRRPRNVFARILNLKNANKEITPDLHDRAENRMWELVQRDSYTNEIASLKRGDPVKSNSKIESLNPFLSKNLIRAKGRLRHANLSFEEKHPVILTHSHPAVKLYLEFQRKHNHQQGVKHIRAEIQRKLWLTGLRNALRSVKHQCLHCKLKRSKTLMPMMSDLPIVRKEDNVTPFTNTGVDNFGPISIKLFRRTVKRWICLFTSLSVRAVHMKIVQSLDTQSCLDAVHRFIARRGETENDNF